jgi:hypothetical protein
MLRCVHLQFCIGLFPTGRREREGEGEGREKERRKEDTGSKVRERKEIVKEEEQKEEEMSCGTKSGMNEKNRSHCVKENLKRNKI